ncbi:MAG: XrtA system polysaccharide deacetylase [Elusimicrobiota bacterium]
MEIQNRRSAGAPMLNALTFDVEDYFMASAFEPVVSKADWERLPGRVAANTRKILGMLDGSGSRATFFVVGWVAEKHPDLVKDIQAGGHEVACHGYHHRLIYEQGPDEFRRDLRRAKQALESAAGRPVEGYRAPSFSIVEETPWAWSILREEGFLYDASVFPAPHARGGLAGAPAHPHRRDGLAEFPMSVVSWAGKNFPFSGGGYFRLLPYALIRRGIQACNRAGRPAILYLHPWELDPGQPRLPAGRLDRFKHYLNLSGTEGKLRRALADFRFDTARNVLTEGLGLLERATVSAGRR